MLIPKAKLTCNLNHTNTSYTYLFFFRQILLNELVQCWNVPATQFAECCNNAENAISNIKPAEEYKMLINKQK